MWIWIAAAASAQDAPPEEPVPTEASADPSAEAPSETEPSGTETDPAETEPSEPSEPEPLVFEIPAVDHVLPSATRRIEDLEALSSDPAELDALLEEAGFDPDDYGYGSLVRGGWYVRPQFAIASLFPGDGGGTAARLGVSAGRRFWTLEAMPVQLAADIGIKATAPVGAGIGRRLEAHGAIGPWLGPARIQLDAGVKWERERWLQKTLELPDAWLLMLGAMVALDLQRVQLHVGMMPGFDLTGRRTRATAGDPVFPVIGTETEWSFGLGVPLNPIGFSIDTSWRDTAIGGLLEVGIGFQFTPRRK